MMADPTRGEKQIWSYIAGERGNNRVRAFEKQAGGDLYLEWFEGEGRRKRRKLGEHAQTRRAAILAAEELAEELARGRPGGDEAPVTLERLIEHYNQEVTPRKGTSTQHHDRRASRLLRQFFNRQSDPGRRMTRHPSSLDRRDWDGFIEARRKGLIPGFRPVGERVIEYDLKYLIAVLNWGSGSMPVGGSEPYLPSGSPWGTEIRRSQSWPMPKNPSPHRPSMTDEIRRRLIEFSPSWQFELALVLGRDTRRRNNSIRQVDWSNVDQQRWTIRWPGEHDKSGATSETPLLGDEAKNALKRAPSRGIAGPVFPSQREPSQPTPRDTFQTWLRRAKARLLASLPPAEAEEWRKKLRGVGYHAEKRAGVRDPRFRALPPKVQEKLAGTKYETLKKVYDEVTSDDVREAWNATRTAETGT